jgi:serine/threonine-protein kinase HipA
MKRARIYYKDILAGLLKETDDGYEFAYLPEYLTQAREPISLTMPLRKEPKSLS